MFFAGTFLTRLSYREYIKSKNNVPTAGRLETFVAHQGIYVKWVSTIAYVHNFLLDKKTPTPT